MRLCVLASVVPAVVAACAGATDPGAAPDAAALPPGVVDSAGLAAALAPYRAASGLRDPQRLVVRDSAHWAAVWAQLAAPPTPGGRAAPAPRVDFARSMVVVAAMGARPSTGFEIAIDSVYRSGGQLRAAVREREVGPSCGRVSAPRAPTAGVLVPRDEGDVAFDEWREFVACY
jgi:hypothetical protein